MSGPVSIRKIVDNSKGFEKIELFSYSAKKTMSDEDESNNYFKA